MLQGQALGHRQYGTLWSRIHVALVEVGSWGRGVRVMWNRTMCVLLWGRLQTWRCDAPLSVPHARSHITGKKKGSWRLAQLQNWEPQPQLDQHGHSQLQLDHSSQLRTVLVLTWDLVPGV